MTPLAQNYLVVVDTNVVSYIFRDDPIGEPYRAALANRRRVISFQTYAELMYGALSSNWGHCPLLSHDRDFGDLPGLQVVHCDSSADDTQH